MSTAPQILLLSDFNMQNFAAALKKNIPGSIIAQIPFNQLYPVLMEKEHAVWKTAYDLVICWVSPDTVPEISSFISVLKNSPALSSRFMMVEFSWDGNRFPGFSEQDEIQRIGEMNVELRKAFTKNNQVVVSPLPWLMPVGKEAYSPKLWYLSKTPFHRDVFNYAAKTIASYWNGWNGRSKKLLILDLDETLWGGIVGDDGWQNLRLGGHDGEGEAFVDFQKSIKRLKENGIILGIVSKNEENIALEAIRSHPEMILKEEDFAGWKINWNDKAQNISDLVKELNLGTDSVVFLDDNPVERERIRTALPQVTVPDLPEDKMLYPRFIASLDVFNMPALTEEDKNRSGLYQQEKLRKEEQEKFIDMDTWLSSLEITLEIHVLNEENRVRAAQLLNKTNQMNLRTRRMSEEELWNWAKMPGNYFYTVHVSDKFGNAGLTGLISFSIREEKAYIEDFVLSCRVMGRKVEESMLGYLVQQAKQNKAKTVIAEYIRTEKNKPCKDFFDRSAMQKENETYSFTIDKPYEIPSYIRITG